MKRDERDEVEIGRLLDEVLEGEPLLTRVMAREAATEGVAGGEVTPRARRPPPPSAFPEETHYGPWEKAPTGEALETKTVQFPQPMWRSCLDLAKLHEMKGAASYVRRAVALQMRRDAEGDPRVLQVLQFHDALGLIGVSEE